MRFSTGGSKMKINPVKFHIFLFILLVLITVPSVSLADSDLLFFVVPEEEEFTRFITVYHPIYPPREAVQEMPMHARLYMNYPSYLRGDLQVINEENAYLNEPPTSFEAPDCIVRIPTENGDTLTVEAVVTNASIRNFDMQVFPSGRGEGWYDIVFSGVPEETENPWESLPEYFIN